VTEREVNLLNCLDELISSVEDTRNSAINSTSLYRNIA